MQISLEQREKQRYRKTDRKTDRGGWDEAEGRWQRNTSMVIRESDSIDSRGESAEKSEEALPLPQPHPPPPMVDAPAPSSSSSSSSSWFVCGALIRWGGGECLASRCLERRVISSITKLSASCADCRVPLFNCDPAYQLCSAHKRRWKGNFYGVWKRPHRRLLRNAWYWVDGRWKMVNHAYDSGGIQLASSQSSSIGGLHCFPTSNEWFCQLIAALFIQDATVGAADTLYFKVTTWPVTRLSITSMTTLYFHGWKIACIE